MKSFWTGAVRGGHEIVGRMYPRHPHTPRPTPREFGSDVRNRASAVHIHVQLGLFQTCTGDAHSPPSYRQRTVGSDRLRCGLAPCTVSVRGAGECRVRMSDTLMQRKLITNASTKSTSTRTHALHRHGPRRARTHTHTHPRTGMLSASSACSSEP